MEMIKTVIWSARLRLDQGENPIFSYRCLLGDVVVAVID